VYDIGGYSGHGIDREGQQAPQIITRQATRDDLEEYYGKLPAGSMRAIVAVMDGRVSGVIGVVREYNIGKFFADFRPELQPHLRSITIMRAIKGALRFADDYRGPVVAMADDAEGCRVLHRLGFTHLQGALYGWLN
jgi:hypothetical protein